MMVHSVVLALLAACVAAGDAARAQTSGCRPEVDHLEITQATQSDPVHTVPLVHNRLTTLRVYVRSPGPCQAGEIDPWVTVPVSPLGYLGAHITFTPYNWREAIDVGPPWNRERENATLNANWVPWGTATETRPVKACVRSAETWWHCKTDYVTFNRRTTPSVRDISINYCPQGSPMDCQNWPDDGLIQPGNGDMLFWAVWPFPVADNTRRYSVATRAEGLKWTKRLGDDGEGVGNQLALLDRLNRMRCAMSSSRRPDYLYGWLSDAATEGAGKGDRHVAWGLTRPNSYQIIFAHELAHAASDKTAFGNHNNSTTGEVGWDVLGRLTAFRDKHVRSAGLKDIMAPSTYATGDHWARPQGGPAATYVLMIRRELDRGHDGDVDSFNDYSWQDGLLTRSLLGFASGARGNLYHYRYDSSRRLVFEGIDWDMDGEADASWKTYRYQEDGWVSQLDLYEPEWESAVVWEYDSRGRMTSRTLVTHGGLARGYVNTYTNDCPPELAAVSGPVVSGQDHARQSGYRSPSDWATRGALNWPELSGWDGFVTATRGAGELKAAIHAPSKGTLARWRRDWRLHGNDGSLEATAPRMARSHHLHHQ
jgi:hypothetical protein